MYIILINNLNIFSNLKVINVLKGYVTFQNHFRHFLYMFNQLFGIMFSYNVYFALYPYQNKNAFVVFTFI